jgi:tetratricopeptide (TPR) repeat protein
MKIDRYAPCPCGSGKKYKFCCESATNDDTIQTLCRRASDFRIETCRVVPGWEEGGMAEVLVARQTPDMRYLVGFYLVDVFCLGVKNTFARRFRDLEEIPLDLSAPTVEITYEDARSLILGAVEYARQWGFEPNPDWSLSASIVEAERPFKRKYTFGKDGKPLYIAGPEDNVAHILRTLDPLLQANKADYIAPDDDWDEDAEFGVEDEDVRELKRLCAEVEENLSNGRLKEAQPAIDRLIREYPDNWEPLFFKATSLCLDGDFQAAVPILERAAAIEPTSIIYFNLASAHKRLFEIHKYLAYLEKAIAVDDDPEITDTARSELNDFAESLRKSSGITLEQFLEGYDDFDHAFECLQKGRVQEAAEGFRKVLAVQPNHVQSHGNLGLVYAAMGNRESALKHLDRAIELDPNYTPAITNRRVVLSLAPGEVVDLNQRKDIRFYPERSSSRQQPL